MKMGQLTKAFRYHCFIVSRTPDHASAPITTFIKHTKPSCPNHTLHASSTVNTNDLAVDPVTILGSEEADHTGNVNRLANAHVWRPGHGVLINLFVIQLVATRDVLAAHGVVHVSLDATGGNAVDSNLLLTSICPYISSDPGRKYSMLHTDSHATNESLNGTFGAGVDSMLWNTLGLAGDGAHEDDPATNFHSLIRLLGDEELATSVDGHDTVVLLLGHVLEVTERDNTRVGAADVELSEVLDDLIHELSSLLGVGDVGFDCNGIGTSLHLLDLLDDILSGFGAVGIVYDNFCATTGKLKGHFLADATACDTVSMLYYEDSATSACKRHLTRASDDGDLALQAPRWDSGSSHCDCDGDGIER